MSDDEAGQRSGRTRLVVAGGFATLAALIALGWSQRTAIATHYVDRALAARGVTASYRITRFGVAGQRLEDVTLGDPAAPDLTARVVELRVAVGLDGPELRAVSAVGVRLRGRIVDGRLSLGAVDRLLPKPSGAPFAIPAIDLALANARLQLATPFGPLAARIDGSGWLPSGFAGRVRAAADAVATSGCRGEIVRADMAVTVRDRQPRLIGPLRAQRARCNGVAVEAPLLLADVVAAPALDRWQGSARVASGPARSGTNRLARLSGRAGFTYVGGEVAGSADVIAHHLASLSGSAASSRFAGRYAFGHKGGSLSGQVSVADGTVAPERLAPVTRLLASVDGSPAGPLGARGARALRTAARRIDADGTIDWRFGTRARLDTTLRLRTADGSAGTVTFATQAQRLRLSGRIGGGYLPALNVALSGRAGALGGTLDLAGYASGDARLAPARISLHRDRAGTLAFSTRLRLDGPLGSGRIEGLDLPIAGRSAASGALVVNPGCAPVAFRRLAIAGLELTATSLPVCPIGRGLLWRAPGGALAGGATIATPRLRGRIGTQPVTVAAAALRVPLAQPGFTANAVTATLGAGDDPTRLEVARLDGRFVAGGVAGRFATAAGKIANVPILMRDGAGTWRLIRGRLAVDGTIGLSDAQAAAPRFRPMLADAVRLTIAGSDLRATGIVREPTTRTAITTVSIRHDLSTGRGGAALDEPALAFTRTLQPEMLTSLTLGVAADVRGTVTGKGRIDWSPAGTTSSGQFGTQALDLAAAFGPVRGLATTIRFTDLLALASAPGQVATVRAIDAGVAVEDGVVRYQLLPASRVQLEGARWPFSGGTLTLAPALLDFGAQGVRRLTFRVDAMDAAKFIERLDVKNLAATGIFDGEVPLLFDQAGGRIVGGHLTARPGGGTLAYVGELSNAQLGLFGKLAFDALKTMRYDRLTILLDGSLDGEVVSRVAFAGTSATPKEGVSRRSLLARFANLPFRFNVTVRAPFRGLVNTAQSLGDPRGLIQRAIDEQRVQPSSSGDTP